MKKIISTFILTIFITNIITFITPKTHASDCFVVTAYYSPLPNQQYYFKWNYDADRILNWNWTHWASWKAVFQWMLAAPSKYTFWTKIYLEWVWVWEVSDRWWAIVQAWVRWYEYDRIDIWMWYWEEWLARALTWWKKTVCNSYVLEEWTSQNVTINLADIPAPKSILASLKKADLNIFTIDIWIKSDIQATKKLHEFLASLWYYKWEINSTYNKDTVTAVFKFQYDNKIVNSTKNNWAWLWWSETRNVAFEIKKKKDDEERARLLAIQKEQEKNNTTNTWTTTQSENTLPIFSKNIWPESDNNDIKNLQTLFKDMWVYAWDISWSYDDIKQVLIDYQLKTKVIDSKENDWAWYFWPKTRTQAKNDYNKILLAKKEEEEKAKKIEIQLAQIKTNVSQRVTSHMESIWNPTEWDVWANVRVLQQTLKTFWYFKVKDTAIFWKTTKDALVKYQIERWIISSKDDDWAWIFWPKTKEYMKNELTTLLEDKLLTEKNLLTYKK